MYATSIWSLIYSVYLNQNLFKYQFYAICLLTGKDIINNMIYHSMLQSSIYWKHFKINACLLVCVCVYIYTSVHVCICTYMENYIYIYVCIYRCIEIKVFFTVVFFWWFSVFIFVSMYACLCLYNIKLLSIDYSYFITSRESLGTCIGLQVTQ